MSCPGSHNQGLLAAPAGDPDRCSHCGKSVYVLARGGVEKHEISKRIPKDNSLGYWKQPAFDIPDRRTETVDEVTVFDHKLTPGTVVAIKGAQGKFCFKYATRSKEGKVSLTFVGGVRGHETFHSFYPERVSRILHTS